MKFHYYPETDSLSIELTERDSVDSQEASPGVVLDYNSDRVLVGIDIDHASSITNISGLQSAGKDRTPVPHLKNAPKTAEVPHLTLRLLRSIFERSAAR